MGRNRDRRKRDRESDREEPDPARSPEAPRRAPRRERERRQRGAGSGSAAPRNGQAPAAPPPPPPPGEVLDAVLRGMVAQLSSTPREDADRVEAFDFAGDCIAAPLRLHAAVYGSCTTGTLIPSSDLDMCVSTTPISRAAVAATAVSGAGVAQPRRMRGAPPEFSAVLRSLRKSREVRRVVPIAHARVPIIKFHHVPSQTDVDVSFLVDGVTTSAYLVEQFAQHPMARPLVVLVKLLLHRWGVDDPAEGGLGSFVTSLLVLWYLRGPVASNFPAPAKANLGALLIGFLRYYGADFPFSRLAIDVGRTRTFPKPAVSNLHVVNPMNSSHNAAAAATNFASQIRPRLFRAAAFLEAAALELAEHPHLRANGQAVLAMLLSGRIGKDQMPAPLVAPVERVVAFFSSQEDAARLASRWVPAELAQALANHATGGVNSATGAVVDGRHDLLARDFFQGMLIPPAYCPKKREWAVTPPPSPTCTGPPLF